ncbi:D-mannonate hydrolase [Thermoplasma volcanium GSS1]|uniref:mannonate dehydratase n=1 Tax=Thermoplasma volcanium (strain ATCC 51530 / DSM 4299 / JCM 9571 / NBRC 15438 / GSS1) TaxID=273116 RepID=Q97CM8_THEVO|nr:mannonate dehydratase [Thermoplasma volcanium]BAB59215.1 D-mannonate hydrolase [Thermoplasma volcanium GSS1]
MHASVKFRIAEIINSTMPSAEWRLLKQIGVNEVVGTLPRDPSDWRGDQPDLPWDYAPLSSLKRRLSEYGLTLSAIEDNPPMEKIKYGVKGKEDELENVLRLIENMGRLKIGVWCYNWMAGQGWMRSRISIPDRGGAEVTGFSLSDIEEYPPPKMGKIDAETLWKNLAWFLDNVIPVAEDSGVKIAMHPDDPPLEEIRGVSRIMNNVKAFDKLIEMKRSEYNTITLCQGNFTLMTEDLPSAIRHFVRKKAVSFVHFRDVKGKKDNFIESFIDDGKTDTASCMSAYIEEGFDGIMRTDHTPTLYGDTYKVPGYSILGRLHAIGYIQGLIDGVSMV